MSAMAPSIYNPNRRQTIDFEPLKQAVHRLLGLEVLEITYLGYGYFNAVHELKMSSGPSLVARITYNFKTDAKSRTWATEQTTRERYVLELVRPFVPVPRILAQDLDPNNAIGAPFTIMERIYGEDQWRALPAMSLPEKIKYVSSLAEMMVRIFQIEMPSIGMLERLNDDGRPVVGPFILDMKSVRMLPPCSTIDEYIAARLDLDTGQGVSYTPSLFDFSVPDLFSRLRVLAARLIPRDDPSLLQPVLVHLDLDFANVMVKDAAVSAIIDWEIHAALPACLAVGYPPFIRYDGMYDPKYDIIDRDYPLIGSCATVDEAPILKAAFRQTAERLSNDFIWALDRGEVLRQLLDFVDRNLDQRLAACYQWERETALALDLA
ncbi:Altered inheritance of mitochondria protein 9, mitochondrial [Hypsizygus marmoreus]|uniref:Altered inheritance of mitochondria protein 9, mitochondrial n=1 Tax=Hypsizygus marmoreus TaxID=39966 RepID=A0A369JGH4_HYPMA|nr:Altered inheritance of mitochondria protein 9, mitochondrial [Hypsizygus marmoreus]